MLVTFYCDAHESITMFGDSALQLLAMMGHSGTVPSAILAAEVPLALSRLEAAVHSGRASEKKECLSEDDEPEISMSQRAFPLIQLLKSAVKANCDVLWQ